MHCDGFLAPPIGATQSIKSWSGARDGWPECELLLVCSLQPLQVSLGGQRITAAKVAATVAGERCWIKWPYLQEATVSTVPASSRRPPAFTLSPMFRAECRSSKTAQMSCQTSLLYSMR